MTVKDYFETGYKEELFKEVSAEENEMLIVPFPIEEIKEVVWECDGNKSPRPDSFNFNEFHNLARLPKVVSALFMALIPKNNRPQGLNDYRPISLLGSLYKMLAKVLAG